MKNLLFLTWLFAAVAGFSQGNVQFSSLTEEPIQFLALVDTNNPATALAALTLRGSNLAMVVDVPSGSTRMLIMCSSNDVLLGGVVWIYAAIPPRPGRTNDFPPLPPLPTNTTSSASVDASTFLPRGTEWSARSLPPVALARLLPSDGADSLVPPAPPGRPPGSTNSVFALLPPRITNQIDLTEEQAGFFLDGFGLMQFIDTNNVITLTAHIRQLDSDHDGVPDSRDRCLDTPPGSLVNTDGCSIDQLSPCDGGWKNHGDFVNAFRAVTAQFQRSGLINARQARELNRAAAQSDCGK